ncbi:choline-sulfatase [Prosthecomicrobium sp. N25]|uniref:choline-sulfatase n=1 Tax=Prosthecomicrobium sp. N25 TaxID=3129254 RepID=UPI00307876B9
MNILIVMADQMAAAALPIYAKAPTRAPHLSDLAARGVVFDSAYCNSPLCAPSRASLMTGHLPSRIGAYDNAAAFGSDVPTVAHYLRAEGYRTVLSGKMHFSGPDQLHGFEERLTTDIYPADFGWTPDWDRPDDRPSWYHNMSSVTDAGRCVRTNQIDYNEEVVLAAERAIYDHARGDRSRPLCLVTSLTHPHDPFAIPDPWWSHYSPEEIELPRQELDPAAMTPHEWRLRRVCDMEGVHITPAHVRDARRAHYAAICYVDGQVGRLMGTLRATGLQDDTVVVVTSDHGEMLGERGLCTR